MKATLTRIALIVLFALALLAISYKPKKCVTLEVHDKDYVYIDEVEV
jgi:hypothetical protein